ncbi:MAG: hypothetical protein ABIR47_12040 [Candidatus Kapaibacterium sp.]
MKTTAKLFCYFLAASYIPAAVVHAILKAILPNGRVFGSLFHMFLYHERYPYQYIGVVALVYAVVASIGAVLWSATRGWRRWIAIIGIMVGTVIIASVPGGILWSIHDMEAGFYPASDLFWSHIQRDALNGLGLGWLILYLSVPYNIIGLIVGYWVTATGFRLRERWKKEERDVAPGNQEGEFR